MILAAECAVLRADSEYYWISIDIWPVPRAVPRQRAGRREAPPEDAAPPPRVAAHAPRTIRCVDTHGREEGLDTLYGTGSSAVGEVRYVVQ